MEYSHEATGIKLGFRAILLTAVAGQRGRGRRDTKPVRARDGGAVLVVVALAVALSACGGSDGTAMPSVPPPSQSTLSANAPGPDVIPSPASAPAPSPTPTAAATAEGWLPALDLATIPVPAAALHVMAGNGGLATWGPRTYAVDEPPRSGQASLVVTDLASGTTTRTAISLLAAETTVPPDGLSDPATIVAADAQWLAVVVWKRLGPTGGDVGTPCSGHEEQPVAWRLLVVPLDPATGRIAGEFRVLDHGTNTHPFTLPGQGEGCGGPRTPRVSLDGDEIAYTVEESGAATTFATRIEVRALPAGSLVRSLERPQEVLFVARSGGTIAFAESQDASTVLNPHWSVGLSTAEHPIPTVAVRGTMDPGYVAPPLIALDGDLLAWQLLNHPEAGMWVERLGASPEQVVPSRLTCWLGGITVGSVGMGCVPTGYQTDRSTPLQPVVWSPATGLRQLAGLPQLVVSSPPSLGGGWLTADGGTPIQGSGTLFDVSLVGLPTRLPGPTALGRAIPGVWTSSDGGSWPRLTELGTPLAVFQAGGELVVLPGGALLADGSTTWFGQAQTR